jgi:G3E family GTPase
MSKLVPATILTGFLGSGKTTLLKRILNEAHGMKIAVIENEFGEENIDNEILVQDGREQIVQMSNGCICCTIRGDLVAALSDLMTRRDAGEIEFDRVVIETTGIANPGPVAQTFFMDDEIATRYLLDAVITLVDARHGNQQLDQHEAAQRQVGFADAIFITKSDLVSADDVAALRHRLVHMNPRAPIRTVNFGETPQDMLGYKHSGFSVDAGVCIEAHDRAALERLLRYCARPPFSMERLRKEGSKLVYRCAKQRSEPTSDKRGAKADELHLTPLELIDRIAALVPPPRTHRHRYFGVLAPNSPLRAAVTALAQPAASQPATVETAQPGAGVPGVAAPGNAATPTPEPEARPKRAAHYLWAVLIARIYEAFPLLCPMCGGQMRIIAFITHSAEIRHILNHIGVESAPPHITPARGPPLWEGCDAPVDDGAQGEPDWDLAAQPDEVDQRVNW